MNTITIFISSDDDLSDDKRRSIETVYITSDSDDETLGEIKRKLVKKRKKIKKELKKRKKIKPLKLYRVIDNDNYFVKKKFKCKKLRIILNSF